MANPRDPGPRDVDELASALVDGSLDADEAARAAADPEVATRAEAIRRLRATLRDVPAAPPTAEDAAVAAAVEAFDEAAVGKDVAPVATSGGEARWLSPRNPRPWLVAAAVLAIVVAAGVFTRRDSSDDDVAATARDAAEEPASQAESTVPSDEDGGATLDASEDNARGEVAPGDVGGTSAERLVADVQDLGDVDGVDELTARVMAGWRDDGAAESSQEAFEPTRACRALSGRGDPERGTSRYVAEARLEGERVIVHLYSNDGAEDELRLVATNEACEDLVDETVRP